MHRNSIAREIAREARRAPELHVSSITAIASGNQGDVWLSDGKAYSWHRNKVLGRDGEWEHDGYTLVHWVKKDGRGVCRRFHASPARERAIDAALAARPN